MEDQKQQTKRRGFSVKWKRGLVVLVVEDGDSETEYPMYPSVAEELGASLRKARKKAVK